MSSSHFTPAGQDNNQPSIRARLPAPMLEAVDIAAALSGMNRSSMIRELLAAGLTRRGLWPPLGGPRRKHPRR